MGYRVEYETPGQVPKKEKRVVMLTAVFLVLFLLLVNLFWPQGAVLLRELALPGDAAITAAALEDLAADLGNGLEISDALESFCRKVIHEAESGSD